MVTASIAKKANAIAASVAASPSMLSSRLKAFVIPTSQRSASGDRDDRRVRRARRACRWRATIAAAANCAASFASGGSARRSSIRPARKSERDPGVDAERARVARGQRADCDGEPDPDAESRGRSRSRRRAASARRASGRRSEARRAVARAGGQRSRPQTASMRGGKGGESREGAHECARVEERC